MAEALDAGLSRVVMLLAGHRKSENFLILGLTRRESEKLTLCKSWGRRPCV